MSAKRRKKIKWNRCKPAVPIDKWANHHTTPMPSPYVENNAPELCYTRRSLWLLLDEGMTNAEIALRLGRPEKTIRRWSNRNGDPEKILPITDDYLSFVFPTVSMFAVK
jgi:hypothetical protein